MFWGFRACWLHGDNVHSPFLRSHMCMHYQHRNQKLETKEFWETLETGASRATFSVYMYFTVYRRNTLMIRKESGGGSQNAGHPRAIRISCSHSHKRRRPHMDPILSPQKGPHMWDLMEVIDSPHLLERIIAILWRHSHLCAKIP